MSASDETVLSQNETSTAGDAGKLGGRLLLVRTADLDDAQRELYRYLDDSKISLLTKAHVQGKLRDGRLIGPFNVFLYSPQAARAFNEWMDAQSDSGSIDPDITQIVILTVGAAWKSPYEIYAHTAAGRQAKLSDNTIRTILAGREPGDVSTRAKRAYRFAYELVTDKSISNATYEDAVEEFKEKTLVDIVNLIGYYLATCALLNAFCVPAP